jgi:predicted nucleotidyltransferase
MNAEPDFGLKPETLDKIRMVLEVHPNVEKAMMYGSRAIGNYRYNSDLDLTLVGKNLCLTEQFQIENELDDLLLPYQIDLSIFHQIENPDLIKHIEEFGKVVFEQK